MDPQGCVVVFRRWKIEEAWNYYNATDKNQVERLAISQVRQILEGEGDKAFFAVKRGPDWGCIYGRLMGKDVRR